MCSVRTGEFKTNHVRKVGHELFRVAEAPLADIEAIDPLSHNILWIERRVPRFGQQVAKHDIKNIWFH